MNKLEKIIDVEVVETNQSIQPEKSSESKQKIKKLAKETSLMVVEGLTFSFKTIRQGLKWATEEDEKPKAVPHKKKRKSNNTVIVIKN
jgi:hypothetical protein